MALRHNNRLGFVIIFGICYVLGYSCVEFLKTRFHATQLYEFCDYYNIDYRYKELDKSLQSDGDYDKELMASLRPFQDQKTNDLYFGYKKRLYINDSMLRSAAIYREQYVSMTQYFVAPQFECPTKVRLATITQEEFSLCNPWAIEKFQSCVVYSFGTKGDSFVLGPEIHEITSQKCSVYYFDEYEAVHGGNKGRLVPVENTQKSWNRMRSILDFARANEHKKIDILKVDIAGFEFSAMPKFVRNFNGTICHLLIELHANWNSDAYLWISLLQMLEKRGFRLFEKEPKVTDSRCMQYSFLHLTCFQDYGVVPGAVFTRYFEHK